MKLNSALTLFLLLSISVFLAIPAEAAGTSPQEIIQDRIDLVVQIINDPALSDSEELMQRKLRKALEPVFDFEEMTRRALGAHGRDLSDQQVGELTVSFKNLLEKIYIARFTSHLTNSGGDTIALEDIRITDYETRGRYARVFSNVVFRQGVSTTRLSLNYRMVDRGNGWHIYDLEIEGVSLISNYRSQFSNILTNHSFDHLLKTIQQMTETADQGTIEADPLPDLPGK